MDNAMTPEQPHRRTTQLEPQIVPTKPAAEFRGMTEAEVEFYFGISAAQRRQLVKDGFLPKPARVGGRYPRWDARQIEAIGHQVWERQS